MIQRKYNTSSTRSRYSYTRPCTHTAGQQYSLYDLSLLSCILRRPIFSLAPLWPNEAPRRPYEDVPIGTCSMNCNVPVYQRQQYPSTFCNPATETGGLNKSNIIQAVHEVYTRIPGQELAKQDSRTVYTIVF